MIQRLFFIKIARNTTPMFNRMFESFNWGINESAVMRYGTATASGGMNFCVVFIFASKLTVPVRLAVSTE